MSPRRSRSARLGNAAPRADRGSFTAELAAGLPALVLLLLVGLTAVTAVGTQLRCVDAAREAALAASRGGPAVAAGRRVAPPGATVTVVTDGERVRVTVVAPVRPLGARLPAFGVEASAVAAMEPGAPMMAGQGAAPAAGQGAAPAAGQDAVVAGQGAGTVGQGAAASAGSGRVGVAP